MPEPIDPLTTAIPARLPRSAQIELEQLRTELAGMRDLFEAANELAGTRTDERDAALARAEAAEDRLRVERGAYARLQAQADETTAARERLRARAEQAEARAATARRVAQHFHDGFRAAADNRENWALAARHVTSLVLGALAGEQITLPDGDE